MSRPERDHEQEEQVGEVVPFPHSDRSPAADSDPDGRSAPSEGEDTGQSDRTGGEVVDAELVDDDGRDPNAEIVLYDADRDEAALEQKPREGSLPAPWQQHPPERRPVVAEWMRTAQQRRQAARWAVEHTAYLTLFHALRVPLYVLRLLLLAPRGAGRITFGLARWVTDAEAAPLRGAAVRRLDTAEYLKLASVQADKVKGRRITLGVGLVLLVAAAVALRYAPWWAQTLAVVAALGTCAHAGRSYDRPLIDPALLSPRQRRLTPDILVRAFLAADLAKEDDPIRFASTPHRDGPGWRVVVDLPYGQTADKAMLKRVGIASGLDVDERQLFLTRVRGAGGSARRIAVWVADTDPLAVPAGPSPLLRAGRVNFWEPWPLGLDERGNEVRLSLLWAAMLIGAIPRQGKTFVARLVALAATLDPHVRLYIYDLKGSPDWVPLAKVAHRFGLGDRPDPETGIDPVRAMLDDLLELQAEVDQRYRTLRTLPTDVAPEGKLTEALARTKSLNMPLVLVSIDEVQRAFEHKELGKQLEDVLTDLSKVAPAVGVMVVASTQKPDKFATPARFRDQFGVRFALRVTSWQVSDVVLGAGAYSEGLDASRLAPDNKGAGLLRGTGDADVAGGVVRTYFADGRDAEQICVRARALRDNAGTLTGAALGEMPTAPTAYSLPADVLAVLGSDDKAHSDVLCSRLADQWPDRYADWQAEQLAAALKPHRIATKQVWAIGLDGQSANRKGLLRTQLLAVLDKPSGGGAGG